jgi:hypothetical protein
MAMRLPHTFVIGERRKGHAIYPWAEWTDGAKWKIVQGEDYKCSDIGMSSRIYNHGVTHGLKVVCSRYDGYIVFQFQGPVKVGAAKHAA